MGHLMMENRNSLIVDARLTEANCRAERATALGMINDNVGRGSTVGGRPHVSQNDSNRRSAIDASTHAILATASAR